MDRKEFSAMAPALRERVIGMAGRICPPDIADDVAQDTLLRLWTMREKLDAYSSIEALTMVIARNRAIDLMREAVTHTGLDGIERQELYPAPDEAVTTSETAAEIDTIMSSLPSVQQAVLRMRHVEGMEIEEIARTIGSKPGAIRTALSRARQNVKELFLKRQL